MDLKQWRNLRSAGEPFVLPSGLAVRVKRVGIVDLAEQGRIPAPLAGIVQSVMDQGSVEMKLEDMARYAAVVNLVVQAALVDPPMADVADDTHIAIDELPSDDRMSIFNWCNEGAQQLTPFREEAG